MGPAGGGRMAARVRPGVAGGRLGGGLGCLGRGGSKVPENTENGIFVGVNPSASVRDNLENVA